MSKPASSQSDPATVELFGKRALTLSVVCPVYNERHVVAASIKRLLTIDDPKIKSMEVIIIDDCSNDGTYEILRQLANEDNRIKLMRHSSNQGKGGALRTGFAEASGEVTVCHDADMEYDPHDIIKLLQPFLEEGADAVFGSRYLSAPYRRALRFRHSLMNRSLTMLSNWFTDLDLTDLETCYKAVRTPLLQSIPLRSDDFRIEVELAFKLAKRQARIFETPIRYYPRTYEEGKKIGAKDGVLALAAMAKYALIDDMYQDDEYGSHILADLDEANRFNQWMAAQIRPFVGNRVLEIGSGIGNLTNQLIPRDRFVASDINPNYLRYLRAYQVGKPYLEVRNIDVTRSEHFESLESCFDTTIMLNVLEHVSDEHQALRNLHNSLEPGGRCIILVPNQPGLYGTLDEALEHRERYDTQHLESSLSKAGFRVDHIFDFNRFSVPGWWLNGKVMKKQTFSRWQIKLVDTITPFMKKVDTLIPWEGLSIIGIGTKE